jgi:Barstar (barnase inhibitor)
MTGRAVGVARVEVLTWHPGAAEPGVWRADLDGSRCRTSGQFLVEIGVVLGFPAYYGRNWDAFDECFSDLLDVTTGGMGYEFYDRPGRPERVLHLVVDHAEELLAEAEPRFLAVVMRNFRCPFPRYDPPQLWHRYADLHVTLVCAADALEAFVSRLRAAGFRPDDLG